MTNFRLDIKTRQQLAAATVRDAVIVAEGLVYEHDGAAAGHPALDGVDLAIGRGQWVALVGRNGSGKSTLVKHFNALLLPTAGRCWVDGLSTDGPENLWTIRCTVGMVFQNPDNQSVAAVVEEDVAFGPENLGLAPDEIRRRVDEALTVTGLGEYRHHAPHLLSGGQKQRLAIAGVLAMRPQVLVLDEATSMLDPQGREEVMGLLARLHRQERMTIVMVTHFMAEAALAQRVVVMDGGRVAVDDCPDRVFADVLRMRELGLAVPLPAELAFRLRQQGLTLPAGVLTEKELVGELCRLS
ncbi:MAG: energy-coupling factor transporter ATPase [Negativicutes bacterium]|nr:energy-coupling factor transporter ATPase [Negativicutes bacterium]